MMISLNSLFGRDFVMVKIRPENIPGKAKEQYFSRFYTENRIEPKGGLNMNKKLICCALLTSLAFAGCSSAPAADDSGTGENPTDVSLLQNVVDSADKDSACYTAWQELLRQNFEQLNNSFFIGSEGNYYEYKDNEEQTFTEENRLYYAARENLFSSGDEPLNIDVTDIDDSYGTLVKGLGLFDRYGKNQMLSAADLTDTENDVLKGTLISADKGASVEAYSAAVNSMVDSLVNFGYIRYVDPIHNASLYNYDLKTTDSGYTLSLSVKDLDAFKKQAAVKSELFDSRTGRDVLGLDQIEEETWTFTFDEKGMLKESENQILHALSAVGQEGFVDLMNKTTVSQDTQSDLNPDAFSTYFASLEDGSLKDGSSFEVQGWK